ncbi:adenylate cyclase [Qingrenia yutianensis]|uniref:Adenylate cyclase n=1 Tax=Qingrenia yutianensis TaxID=2763676 RepID=A0A926FFJ9_9FIRM|nr:adenylate cyclase [Qingrenia yutianensis]MBC8597544.1 adenylate cyclase [Qingrenia yutianensis]
MNREIVNTNIRFNLNNADDIKAYNYLQNMDRKKYKSYTKVVVIALIEHFERQQRLEADSYLETREKEDIFLQKVLDTIEQGLKTAGNISGLIQLLSASTVQQPQVQHNIEEDTDAALNFADGF